MAVTLNDVSDDNRQPCQQILLSDGATSKQNVNHDA